MELCSESVSCLSCLQAGMDFWCNATGAVCVLPGVKPPGTYEYISVSPSTLCPPPPPGILGSTPWWIILLIVLLLLMLGLLAFAFRSLINWHYHCHNPVACCRRVIRGLRQSAPAWLPNQPHLRQSPPPPEHPDPGSVVPDGESGSGLFDDLDDEVLYVRQEEGESWEMQLQQFADATQHQPSTSTHPLPTHPIFVEPPLPPTGGMKLRSGKTTTETTNL